MAELVYTDEHDDITTLRARLAGVDASPPENSVAVVVPKGNRSLSSQVAMRLLQREAESLALEVSLVSGDPTLRRIAKEEGLRVYGSTHAYQRATGQSGGRAARSRAEQNEGSDRASTLISTALVLGFLLLAAALIFVFLPVSTVRVAPRSEVISGTVTVTADPAVRAIDVAAKKIPARTVFLLVDASDVMAPREGRKIDDGRAVGIVTFTNRGAQETIVPRGTVVSTVDGVRFRTDAEVKLAPGLGQAGRVRIVAVDPGAAGNISRLRITKIETALVSRLAQAALVQNEEPTAGGGNPGSSVVTADDQDRLRTRTQDRAQKEVLAKLAEMPKGRELLVKESIEFTPLDVSFDQEIGREADLLNIRLKARVAGTIINLDDLDDVARQTWAPVPRVGFDVGPEGVKFGVPGVDKVDGQVVTMIAKPEATSYARIDIAHVQQLARWRSVPDAQAELGRAFDLAAPPTIRVAPNWSGRAYRVDVVVDTTSGG